MKDPRGIRDAVRREEHDRALAARAEGRTFGSGAPAGTYFLFVARKALSEIDGGAAIHAAAYQAALGGPEGQKKMAANTAAAVISSQTDLFAFAPPQSVPPPEWVAADPTYWKHKVHVKKTP